MLVAACLDAGLDLERLEAELSRLPLSGYRLDARRVRRRQIAGTQFSVEERRAAGHRSHADIRDIVAGAGYEAGVEAKILNVFRILAEAESRVHEAPVEELHFHEVGAVDSIIDVCGTVLAFHLLELERVHASWIALGAGSPGGGTVDCAHGLLPVPAPATLEILKGLPVRRTELPGERCTPTGAALLRVLVDEFRTELAFRPLEVGYGAGSSDAGPVPNLLRLTIGETEDPPGQASVWELSLSVDNVTGELLGHALRSAVRAGALDAWALPAVTKKNRPAHSVVVLSDEAHRERLEELLLTELPTLGLRRQRVERRTLPRRVEERDTALGRLRFKVRTLPDGTELAHPEADDVERVARETGKPVPVVLAMLGPGC